MFVSIVFLAGCKEDKPPLEVFASPTTGGTALKITALADVVNVENYSINRGNCDEPYKLTLSLQEYNDYFEKRRRTLKFADSMYVEAKCTVKEITIYTDDNEYTFTFK